MIPAKSPYLWTKSTYPDLEALFQLDSERDSIRRQLAWLGNVTHLYKYDVTTLSVRFSWLRSVKFDGPMLVRGWTLTPVIWLTGNWFFGINQPRNDSNSFSIENVACLAYPVSNLSFKTFRYLHRDKRTERQNNMSKAKGCSKVPISTPAYHCLPQMWPMKIQSKCFVQINSYKKLLST